MTSRDCAEWFKTTFQGRIAPKVAGTPFCADLLTAIAMQETGYIWGPRTKRLSESDLLKVCVGDTIDAPSRSAFPRNKADLLAAPRGGEMFRIAREALEFVALHDSVYAKIARNPSKFCHGCLDQCIRELHAAMTRQGWAGKPTLTSTEKIYLAIAYNRGRAKLGAGFKQGHCSEGRYYGENIFEFFRIAQTVTDPVGAVVAGTIAPELGPAPLPPPSEVTALGGDVFQVDPRVVTSLRLRFAPIISSANIVARLPAGTLVHKLGGKRSGRFLEVESSLSGAYFRGFAANEFLLPLTSVTQIPVLRPESVSPIAGLTAANLAAGNRRVTRIEPAGALSLNEPDAPSRKDGGRAGPRTRGDHRLAGGG